MKKHQGQRMERKKRYSLFLWMLLLSVFLFATGCQKAQQGTEKNADGKEEQTPVMEKAGLTIYSPHSMSIIWKLVQEFEKQTGIPVDVISDGTGNLISRLTEEAQDPQADIIWGGTVSLLGTNKEYFEPYVSPNESSIIDAYKNTTGCITSFTIVPSVLIVNTELAKDIEINGYADLLKPELKGRIACCDPAKSSSSYEQLINILNAMGNGNPENGWDYMGKLIAQLDGKLVDSSSAVVESVVNGESIVGLTYEEGAISNMVQGAPVKVVYMEEGVICRADGLAIIKNAKNMENAKKFVDFITGKEAQDIVTQSLCRRSIRTDVEPLEGILSYDEIKTIQDDVDWATENKDAIIERFDSNF